MHVVVMPQRDAKLRTGRVQTVTCGIRSAHTLSLTCMLRHFRIPATSRMMRYNHCACYISSKPTWVLLVEMHKRVEDPGTARVQTL
jgi:hypothetical protein